VVRPPDADEPTAAAGQSTPGDTAAERERRGRHGSPPERLRAVWHALPRERRLAVLAAVGLVVTLFLPWYQETVIAQGTTASLSTVSASLTGWGAFSFVEAAILLVAAAVIVLVFVRAEGAAFHVPGGDGGVVTAAGIWSCLLIIWRMFDKEGTTAHGLYETASGIEWGIFIALGMAALLTYAGSLMKLANEPEPPLPGERPSPRRRPRPTATTPAPVAATPQGVTPGPERPARPRPSATPSPGREVAPAGRAPGRPRGRRIRPSSLSDAPTVSDPPTIRDASPPRSPREDAPTEVGPDPADAAARSQSPRRPRPHRGLDFTELEQISFDDPPEAPTVRRREPEDPLTTRLDRPD
jgi:hypothetical protein